ncbi:MAG TPA: type II secretion system protein GspE [Lentisphaeria bacterium]|nr:MAG: type II secretion system protein GspE [Lentisphaerae bacterium GWF2_50_93]HCE45402.1 type II secretion system protein GspE [Lentisphaeria bacterium]
MAKNSEYTLELLLESGMLSQEQIDQGWQKVADSGGKMDILDALKELKFINEKELLSILAQQYGLETIELAEYQIPPEVVESMTSEIVKEYKVLPVMKHENTITIAISDPSDLETIDALRFRLKCDIEAVVASRDEITKLIDHYYGTIGESVDSFLEGMEGGNVEAQIAGAIGGADEAVEDDAPIIKLVSLIIIEAFKKRASDIHLEPLEKRYRVRYRIDGALREVEGPPKYLQPNITSRLKIMSKLDISEKRVPQDGRIQLKVEGKDIDLRVSTIPTTHGESIVMRILDKSSIQLDIPKLGFYSDDEEIIKKILALPDGIFLVTGPTGSGKTTSLYAFLNTINTPNRKIITVEDPVEYQLGGINQVQVNPIIKFTFSAALRAMLRQAPNIIMVGEIRDLETAEIAINASLTGHLVFSTLHTNDAPGAVTRLIDMGVKPFLVASAVKAIMAQRLVRRNCKNCSVPYEPDEEELQILGLDKEFVKSSTLMKGRGCNECGGGGYRGRVGIYEIFMITEQIQNLIYEKVSSSVIREAARKSGMRTLREDGLRKAAAGTTTLAEVLSNTVMDEASDH